MFHIVQILQAYRMTDYRTRAPWRNMHRYGSKQHIIQVLSVHTCTGDVLAVRGCDNRKLRQRRAVHAQRGNQHYENDQTTWPGTGNAHLLLQY